MEAKIKKMQEMFNKDLEELKNKHLEELKNKQTEMNNTITEMKNILEGITGHLPQRNENLFSQRNLYTNVHCSFICNSP